MAFALAVAKPQSGNLGGGGFLTYYDAASRGVWTLDFREAAPAAAKQPARPGAAAAVVPGTVAGIAALHDRFGSKKWETLVEPAVDLAMRGVKVDPDLANAIQSAKQFPNEKLAAGATLVQNELASTLERIA